MSTPYATLAAPSSHGGTYMATRCDSVLAEGFAPLCAGDVHLCPCLLPGGSPHPSLPLPAVGNATVLVGGRPWLLAGQTHPCAGAARILAQGTVVQGALTEQARITDNTLGQEPPHVRFSC